MNVYRVTALADSRGPDITGRIVPIASGATVLVPPEHIGYYRVRPTEFSVGATPIDTGTLRPTLSDELTALSVVRQSPSGALVGADGEDVLPGALATSGQFSRQLSPATTVWGVVGDSIAAYLELNASATSAVANPDGTVAVTGFGTTNGGVIGTLVRLQAAHSESANITDGIITAATTTTCTVMPLSDVRSVQTGTPVVSFATQLSAAGPLSWLQFLTKKRFDYEWMAAGGNTIDQVITLIGRRRAENGGRRLDAIYCCAGANNIYAAGESFDTVTAAFQRLFSTLAQFCCPVFIATIPPRDHTHSAWTSAKQTVHYQVNSWLWSAAMAYGFVPIDTWGATFNGVTYVQGAGAYPDPSTSFSSDGTHPAALGGAAIAYEMLPYISAMQAARFDPVYPGQLTEGNYLTNPQFAGGTANPTSWETFPSGGTPSTTRTTLARTVATDGDNSGANWSVVFSDSTGGCTYTMRQTGITVPAGTEIAFAWPMKLSNIRIIGLIQASVWITTPGGIIVASHGINGTSRDISSLEFNGVFSCPAITVPADATDITTQLRFTSSAASATMNIVCNKPQLRDAS